MLCCLLEAAMLVWGIVVLVQGKLALGSLSAYGGYARMAGLSLMLAFPIGVGGELIIGVKLGIEAGQKGQQVDPMKLQQEILVPVLICHGVGLGVSLLGTVLFTALGQGKGEDPEYTSRRRRRRRDEDEDDVDDEDDRPRRRRDEDEDDDYR